MASSFESNGKMIVNESVNYESFISLLDICKVNPNSLLDYYDDILGTDLVSFETGSKEIFYNNFFGKILAYKIIEKHTVLNYGIYVIEITTKDTTKKYKIHFYERDYGARLDIMPIVESIQFNI